MMGSRFAGSLSSRPVASVREGELDIRTIVGPSRVRRRTLAALAALAVGCGGREPEPAADAPINVAVAANFSATQDALAARFTELTGTPVVASAGSTGQLFAQIQNGAPFHVFLSADQERPQQLEAAGLAVAGSRFSYAEGRLALYGPGLDSVRADAADLRDRTDARVAIANPETAPYGAAAVAAIEKLGLARGLAPRIVQGESIAQADQFVRSGSAELGFVALSQVIHEPASRYWVVPRELHAPILQDAVLLVPGRSHPAAQEYLDFLKGEEARRIIEADGYSIPAGG
jgi:molybdate transport system substrate-binding protein